MKMISIIVWKNSVEKQQKIKHKTNKQYSNNMN